MAADILFAALIGSAETSLNTLLQKDAKTLQQLGKMSGKVIRFDISQPSVHLTLIPSQSGIDLLLHSNATPDLTLTGHATDFLQMLRSEHPDTKLFGKGIDVHGDTGLATQFSSVLRGFSIDWEAWLADYIGDTAAHPVASFFNQQSKALRQASQSLSDNTLEYLQEEIKLLPPRVEVEAFIDQIEQLRDDVDRLEARIKLAQFLKKVSSRQNKGLE